MSATAYTLYSYDVRLSNVYINNNNQKIKTLLIWLLLLYSLHFIIRFIWSFTITLKIKH